MTTLNLKSLQQKTEKKYPALKIEVGENEVLTFRNLLRLPENDRKAFKKIQDARAKREEELKAAEEAGNTVEVEDASADTIQYFRSALTLVSDNKDLCQRFLDDEVGDDLATLATIFEIYANKDGGKDSEAESDLGED